MRKILLAFNQPILTIGVSMTLKSEIGNCELTVVNIHKDAIEELPLNDYTTAIVDFGPMTVNYVEQILDLYPSLSILIFTDSMPFSIARELYRKGLSGVLFLSAPLDEVKAALIQVIEGKLYMCEAFKKSLIESQKTEVRTPFKKLSRREAEVAELLLMGKRVSEIGRGLHLKPSTIATFKKSIFAKLGVTTILELEMVSRKSRLVS